MCNNENVIIARRTGEQRKESHSLKRELFVARIFYYTSRAALFILLSGFHRNSTRRRQERCSMIKQHRTTDKTIKSRAETFVGCIFDEISWRLWSHLSSSSRCGARALQRKKEESTRTGIGSANAKRLSLNNSLTRRVGRQRGRRNSRGLG